MQEKHRGWLYVFGAALLVLLGLAFVPAARADTSPYDVPPPPGYTLEQVRTPSVGANATRWNSRAWTSDVPRVQPGAPSNVGHAFAQGFATVVLGEPYIDDGKFRFDGLYIQPYKFHYITQNRNPWQLYDTGEVTFFGSFWCENSAGGQHMYSLGGQGNLAYMNSSNFNQGTQFISFKKDTSDFRQCVNGVESVTYVTLDVRVTQSGGPGAPLIEVDKVQLNWDPKRSYTASGGLATDASCIGWFGIGTQWKPWDTVTINGEKFTAEELGCEPNAPPGIYDSFEYLCRDAPQLSWGDWAGAGEWLAHYANCLFVPYRLEADPVVLALEESPVGESMDVAQLVQGFPTGEYCGNIGELPVVGEYSTCSIPHPETWRTVIRWTVIIGAAWFILDLIGRNLVDVRIGRQEVGEE